MYWLGVESISASLIAIITVLLACIIGAGGAVLLKKEASKVSFRKLRLSLHMFFGLCLYGVSTLFFILSLRGSQLSILYPLTSTTYAWTAIFSFFFLKEKIGTLKIAGIFFIFLGVSVIAAFK
ncbi:MAG: EamA family transporter [Nanoarchaeota archaeon]